jgi:hypothetical protein
MTSAITQLREALSGVNTLPFSDTASILLIILLIVLLVQKELVRATRNRRSKIWMQTLDIALAPILIAVGFMVIMRVLFFVIASPG